MPALTEHAGVPAPLISWAPGGRLLRTSPTGDSIEPTVITQTPRAPAPLKKLFLRSHRSFLVDYDDSLPELFRVDILACKQELLALPDADQHAGLIKGVEKALALWHFIEIVHVRPSQSSPNEILGPDLSDWYITNYPRTFQADMKEERDLFSQLLRLICVGRLKEALQLIAEHLPQEQCILGDPKPGITMASPLAVLEAMLRKCPSPSVLTHMDGTWAAWQRQCDAWANSEEMDNKRELQYIFGAMSGKADAIRCSVQYLEMDWKFMMVTCGFYLRAAGADVSEAASEALDMIQAAPDLEPEDEALIQAALGNLHEALRKLGAKSGTFYFGAHLSDLLWKRFAMMDRFDEKMEDIREFFFRRYGRELECMRGCWRIAADYYMECRRGGGLLVDMIRKLDLQVGDRTTEKALEMCNVRTFGRTGRDICERMGLSCLSCGNRGGAMKWFLRAALEKRCDEVVSDVMKRAEIEGMNSEAGSDLAFVSTVIALHAKQHLATRYEYVRQYYQVMEAGWHLKAGEVKWLDTFAIGVRRLLSGGLPKRFWGVLCYDTAKVIENVDGAANALRRGGLQDVMSGFERGDTVALQLRLQVEGGGHDDEEVRGVVRHCRTVFVRSLAKLIHDA